MFMLRFSEKETTIQGKIFGTKKRNPVKLDRTRKVWCLLLRAFWLVSLKFNFWKGDWALGYVSTQIWDFPNISWFPKILSLTSIHNSWGNSYTKFDILDITFCFGSVLKHCKFQNVMTKIVGAYWECWSETTAGESSFSIVILCNYFLLFKNVSIMETSNAGIVDVNIYGIYNRRFTILMYFWRLPLKKRFSAQQFWLKVNVYFDKSKKILEKNLWTYIFSTFSHINYHKTKLFNKNTQLFYKIQKDSL